MLEFFNVTLFPIFVHVKFQHFRITGNTLEVFVFTFLLNLKTSPNLNSLQISINDTALDHSLSHFFLLPLGLQFLNNSRPI